LRTKFAITLREAGLGSSFDVRRVEPSKEGSLSMSDNEPEVDVTAEWRATHGQQSAAARLRTRCAARR
jgi:hypothetical protein